MDAFGQGSLKQKYANLNFTPDTPIFSWQPTSWNLDGWGYFGYSVNLTADRTYHVILIPMIGYGVNVEQLDSDGIADPLPALLVFPAQSFSMTTALTGKGENVLVRPSFSAVYSSSSPEGRLQFEAGYAYHRLHLRFRIEKTNQCLSLFGKWRFDPDKRAN